jgi:hypothetical protein
MNQRTPQIIRLYQPRAGTEIRVSLVLMSGSTGGAGERRVNVGRRDTLGKIWKSNKQVKSVVTGQKREREVEDGQGG